MIERQIIAQKVKEQQIKEFIYGYLNKSSYSHTEIQRTPLGERIVIYTSRPGLVVGRGGSNIVDLTRLLKDKFGLENPQIEVSEIENPSLNAQSVAKRIVSLFERFGPKRFKSIGYKVLESMISAGALGAEIVISGRGVPSSRAKSWRFKAGYLKKSGDIAQNYVDKGYVPANLRSGVIGVRVSILGPEVMLPDKISLKKAEEHKEVKQEIKVEVEELKTKEKKEAKEKKKRATKKKEDKPLEKPSGKKEEVKREDKKVE